MRAAGRRSTSVARMAGSRMAEFMTFASQPVARMAGSHS